MSPVEIYRIYTNHANIEARKFDLEFISQVNIERISESITRSKRIPSLKKLLTRKTEGKPVSYERAKSMFANAPIHKVSK